MAIFCKVNYFKTLQSLPNLAFSDCQPRAMYAHHLMHIMQHSLYFQTPSEAFLLLVLLAHQARLGLFTLNVI